MQTTFEQRDVFYTHFRYRESQIIRILSKQVGPAEVLLTSVLVKPTALLRHRNHVFGLLPCKPTWHNSGEPGVSRNIAKGMLHDHQTMC